MSDNNCPNCSADTQDKDRFIIRYQCGASYWIEGGCIHCPTTLCQTRRELAECKARSGKAEASISEITPLKVRIAELNMMLDKAEKERDQWESNCKEAARLEHKACKERDEAMRVAERLAAELSSFYEDWRESEPESEGTQLMQSVASALADFERLKGGV